MPKIEPSKVEHKAMDFWLDEWTGFRAVKKGMSLISMDL